MNLKNIFIWSLRMIAALILLQTLYFKFSAHPQSVALFTKIGLEPYGRIGIGVLELIASILILIPRTTAWGALLGAGLMSGALFFHLTSLGIQVDGDSILFIYALIEFITCIILIILFKNELLMLIQSKLKNKASFFNMVLLMSISMLFSNCSFSQKKTNMSNKANSYYKPNDSSQFHVSDEELKKVLDPMTFSVAREKATERAFTGEYWNTNELGTYHCKVCGNPLFKSDGKFESSCGWPSFFEPITKESVIYEDDNSYGMHRVEVMCGRCHSHLGHIFNDGPPPTYKRYCINSVVLNLEKK